MACFVADAAAAPRSYWTTIQPGSTLTAEQALNSASFVAIQLQIATHRRFFALPVSGTSMLPTCPRNFVVVCEQIPAADLSKGDFIVFRFAPGHAVAHRVFEKTAHGWWTRGDNNLYPDSAEVTDANLIGRVVAVFYVHQS
jgi:signal peptidase I